MSIYICFCVCVFMGIVCERNKEVKGRKINAKGEKEWGVGGGEK